MPAQILSLITDRDNCEVVRDRIAEILLIEVASQKALAAAADPLQDPDDWDLRVFTERTNPWDEFLPCDGDEEHQSTATPIVNVWFDTSQFDSRSSDTVERQKATVVYNIDCYGYGVSSDGDIDHDAGDARAALEAQRAMRLVRKILMAGPYTYLGLPRGSSQLVWGRRVQSIQTFQPQIGDRPAFHVSAIRIAFEVGLNEFSPQYEAENLEELAVNVKRSETGEVFLTYQVGESSP